MSEVCAFEDTSQPRQYPWMFNFFWGKISYTGVRRVSNLAKKAELHLQHLCNSRQQNCRDTQIWPPIGTRGPVLLRYFFEARHWVISSWAVWFDKERHVCHL